MNTAKQIELVKSWGFSTFITDQTFKREAPQGFTEWWSISRPDYIEFSDKNGQFSHDYKINWALFDK